MAACLIWASGNDITCAKSATTARAQPTIVADVDMYEWAASSSLRLDTRSGRYTKTWNPGGLPPGVTVLPPEHGILAGHRLERLRSIVARTISSWATGHGAAGNCEPLAPGASIPQMKIVWDHHVLANGTCWTPEEFELRRAIEDYFGSTPADRGTSSDSP